MDQNNQILITQKSLSIKRFKSNANNDHDKELGDKLSKEKKKYKFNKYINRQYNQFFNQIKLINRQV